MTRMRSAVRICHLPPLFKTLKNMPSQRSKTEWVVIVVLTILFGSIWLFAHWNLSRKPPHHKGPGSAGYVEPTIAPESSPNPINE